MRYFLQAEWKFTVAYNPGFFGHDVRITKYGQKLAKFDLTQAFSGLKIQPICGYISQLLRRNVAKNPGLTAVQTVVFLIEKNPEDYLFRIFII